MADVTRLNSNDYILKVDLETPITALRGNPAKYKTLACAVSVGFEGTTDPIDITPDRCSAVGFASTLPGSRSWTFPFSGNAIDDDGQASMVSFETAMQLWKDGTLFWAMIAKEDPLTGVAVIREGVVWISQHTETLDTNTAYAYSATFTGVGEILTVQTT